MRNYLVITIWALLLLAWGSAVEFRLQSLDNSRLILNESIVKIDRILERILWKSK